MNNTNTQSTSVQRCPYIGVHDDRSTALGYPSTWNYCYHATPPASVLTSHQVEACLCPLYVQCAVYLSSKSKPLPSSLRGKTRIGIQKHGSSRKLGRSILFLLAALGILVFLAQYLPFATELSRVLPFNATSNHLTKQPPDTDSATLSNLIPNIPTESNSFIPNPSSIAAGQNTDFAFTPGSLTSVAQQTDNPSLTSPPVSTKGLTLTSTPVGMCGHALDVPFGADIKFVLHRVESGENLTLYAEQYHTSINAILTTNYHLPMPIWEDWIIVIPVGATNVSGIPSFEPYQAIETTLSLGELAQKLNTDSQSLYKHNAFEGPCQIFSGWLIIPRRARTD